MAKGRNKGKPQTVTKSDIATIAKKLQEFSEQLEPKEQALLRLLLARADEDVAIDAYEFVPETSVSRTVSRGLQGLLGGRGVRVSGWVEAGDPWVQSGGGWVEAGDPWVQSGGGGWVEAGDPWVQSGARKFENRIRIADKASQLGRFFNAKILGK